jgi:hypothetical protein
MKKLAGLLFGGPINDSLWVHGFGACGKILLFRGAELQLWHRMLGHNWDSAPEELVLAISADHSPVGHRESTASAVPKELG